MIKVTVCIGSSCHLKGSRRVVEELQYLVNVNNLNDRVDLNGTFCIGKCSADGVSVLVNDEFYAVKPENTKNFFDDVIVKQISK